MPFEEVDDQVFAFGPGWTSQSLAAYSGGSAWRISVVGRSVEISFSGDQVRLIGAVGPNCGVGSVSIDGVDQGEVDTYAPSYKYGREGSPQPGSVRARTRWW